MLRSQRGGLDHGTEPRGGSRGKRGVYHVVFFFFSKGRARLWNSIGLYFMKTGERVWAVPFRKALVIRTTDQYRIVP